MKREEFLKNAAALAGSFAFIGCSDELMVELTGTDELDTISIDEARKWFSEVYLNKYAALKTEGDGKKKYRRKANWDKATNKKDDKKQDFVWVPVEYEDDLIPGIMLMDENSAFKQSLAKYLVQPVIEGMAVRKKKNAVEASLIQLAFDPISVRNNGNKLELSKFTGTLLRADWDDNVNNVVVFKNGKKTEAYGPEESINSRIGTCFEIEVWYQTVGVIYRMDGTYEWTVTLHKVRRSSCTPMGTSGGSYGGGVSVNGSPTYGGASGTNGVDIPGTHQTYLRPNYDVQAALTRNGSQRSLLNQRLDDFLKATTLGVSVLDFTLTKAEALAKVIGAEVKILYPTAYVLGKRVTVLSLFLDGKELLAVWTDAGWDFNRVSTWDQVKTIVWGTAAVAVAINAFWLGAAFGTISLGMAVYDELD